MRRRRRPDFDKTCARLKKQHFPDFLFLLLLPPPHADDMHENGHALKRASRSDLEVSDCEESQLSKKSRTDNSAGQDDDRQHGPGNTRVTERVPENLDRVPENFGQVPENFGQVPESGPVVRTNSRVSFLRSDSGWSQVLNRSNSIDGSVIDEMNRGPKAKVINDR
jgi:hypothetical protein